VSQATGNNIRLSIDQTRESVLLAEWSSHTLSYSVYQPKSNTVLFSGVSEVYFDLFDYNEQEFSRLIAEEPVFQYSFQKVIFLVSSSYYEMIPDALYQSGIADNLLSFNHKLPSGNLSAETCKPSVYPYRTAYALPKTLMSAWQTGFHNFSANHLVNALLLLAEDGYLHAHVGEGMMTAILIKNKEITFVNSYNFDTPEDLTYNLLNVYQHLGLNTEKDKLVLSGRISSESEYFQLLYKYIHEIDFVQKTARLNYSEQVTDMPSHYFVHHYTQFL
jgi:hypothetical protein